MANHQIACYTVFSHLIPNTRWCRYNRLAYVEKMSTKVNQLTLLVHCFLLTIFNKLRVTSVNVFSHYFYKRKVILNEEGYCQTNKQYIDISRFKKSIFGFVFSSLYNIPFCILYFILFIIHYILCRYTSGYSCTFLKVTTSPPVTVDKYSSTPAEGAEHILEIAEPWLIQFSGEASRKFQNEQK